MSARTSAEQAQQLLAAREHNAAAHPAVHQLAETLAHGRLAERRQIEGLSTPPTCTQMQLQQDALGDYPQRRAAAIDATWHALRWRDGRRTSREGLAAAHDDEHLLICATCEITYTTSQVDDHHWRCQHCDTDLLEWPQRDQVVPLARRLEILRRRLGTTVR